MPDPPLRFDHVPPAPPPIPRWAGGRHRLRSGAPAGLGGGGAGSSRWRLLAGLLVDRLPGHLRAARVGPGRRAVGGLIAVVVMVAVVLGLRLAMASAAARPVPVPGAASTSGLSTATPVAADPSTSPSPNQSGTVTAAPTGTPGQPAALLVQVAGRVRRPGVIRLPAGSRVQDALRAAGGALPGSDLVGINLAQPLVDGEQVLVARTGHGSSVSTTGPAGGSSGSPAAGSGAAAVDLNTGDVTALDALPGVGPVLAQRIVDWRAAHGRFTSVDELDEVSGIGDKLLAEIRPHVQL